MKVNIQKIAYRAIPVLTAFVVLLSCVVVGDPFRVNASILDYTPAGTNADPTYPFVEMMYSSPSDVCRIDYFDGSSVSYNWANDERGRLSAHTSFSLFLPFNTRWTRSDVSGVATFSGLDYFTLHNSYESAWAPYTLTLDYVFLHYYDANGNWVADQRFYRQGNSYSGVLSWPSNATYFTYELARCYEGGASDAYVYFDFRNENEGGFGVSTISSYNVGVSGNMRYYWPHGSNYGSIRADFLTVSPTYHLYLSNYPKKEYISSVLDAQDFMYLLEAHDSLNIEYRPNVVFDIYESLATDCAVVVDDIKAHIAGSGEARCSVTDPVFVVDYYDEYGGLLTSQEAVCGCGEDNWSSVHRYQFHFAYPKSARYMKFRLIWSFSADGDVGFFIGFDRFTMDFDRNQADFDKYVSEKENQPGYILPGIDSGNGPELNPGDMGLDTFVDADAFTALSSPIRALWNVRVLYSSLVIVVSLCLVSWIFFGKKG